MNRLSRHSPDAGDDSSVSNTVRSNSRNENLSPVMESALSELLHAPVKLTSEIQNSSLTDQIVSKKRSKGIDRSIEILMSVLGPGVMVFRNATHMPILERDLAAGFLSSNVNLSLYSSSSSNSASSSGAAVAGIPSNYQHLFRDISFVSDRVKGVGGTLQTSPMAFIYACLMLPVSSIMTPNALALLLSLGRNPDHPLNSHNTTKYNINTSREMNLDFPHDYRTALPVVPETEFSQLFESIKEDESALTRRPNSNTKKSSEVEQEKTLGSESWPLDFMDYYYTFSTLILEETRASLERNAFSLAKSVHSSLRRRHHDESSRFSGAPSTASSNWFKLPVVHDADEGVGSCVWFARSQCRLIDERTIDSLSNMDEISGIGKRLSTASANYQSRSSFCNIELQLESALNDRRDAVCGNTSVNSSAFKSRSIVVLRCFLSSERSPNPQDHGFSGSFIGQSKQDADKQARAANSPSNTYSYSYSNPSFTFPHAQNAPDMEYTESTDRYYHRNKFEYTAYNNGGGNSTAYPMVCLAMVMNTFREKDSGRTIKPDATSSSSHPASLNTGGYKMQLKLVLPSNHPVAKGLLNHEKVAQIVPGDGFTSKKYTNRMLFQVVHVGSIHTSIQQYIASSSVMYSPFGGAIVKPRLAQRLHYLYRSSVEDSEKSETDGNKTQLARKSGIHHDNANSEQINDEDYGVDEYPIRPSNVSEALYKALCKQYNPSQMRIILTVACGGSYVIPWTAVDDSGNLIPCIAPKPNFSFAVGNSNGFGSNQQGRQHPYITTVIGPPGTGKTRTISGILSVLGVGSEAPPSAGKDSESHQTVLSVEQDTLALSASKSDTSEPTTSSLPAPLPVTVASVAVVPPSGHLPVPQGNDEMESLRAAVDRVKEMEQKCEVLVREKDLLEARVLRAQARRAELADALKERRLVKSTMEVQLSRAQQLLQEAKERNDVIEELAEKERAQNRAKALERHQALELRRRLDFARTLMEEERDRILSLRSGVPSSSSTKTRKLDVSRGSGSSGSISDQPNSQQIAPSKSFSLTEYLHSTGQAQQTPHSSSNSLVTKNNSNKLTTHSSSNMVFSTLDSNTINTGNTVLPPPGQQKITKFFGFGSLSRTSLPTFMLTGEEKRQRMNLTVETKENSTSVPSSNPSSSAPISDKLELALPSTSKEENVETDSLTHASEKEIELEKKLQAMEAQLQLMRSEIEQIKSGSALTSNMETKADSSADSLALPALAHENENENVTDTVKEFESSKKDVEVIDLLDDETYIALCDAPTPELSPSPSSNPSPSLIDLDVYEAATQPTDLEPLPTVKSDLKDDNMDDIVVNGGANAEESLESDKKNISSSEVHFDVAPTPSKNPVVEGLKNSLIVNLLTPQDTSDSSANPREVPDAPTDLPMSVQVESVPVETVPVKKRILSLMASSGPNMQSASVSALHTNPSPSPRELTPHEVVSSVPSTSQLSSKEIRKAPAQKPLASTLIKKPVFEPRPFEDTVSDYASERMLDRLAASSALVASASAAAAAAEADLRRAVQEEADSQAALVQFDEHANEDAEVEARRVVVAEELLELRMTLNGLRGDPNVSLISKAKKDPVLQPLLAQLRGEDALAQVSTAIVSASHDSRMETTFRSQNHSRNISAANSRMNSRDPSPVNTPSTDNALLRDIHGPLVQKRLRSESFERDRAAILEAVKIAKKAENSGVKDSIADLEPTDANNSTESGKLPSKPEFQEAQTSGTVIPVVVLAPPPPSARIEKEEEEETDEGEQINWNDDIGFEEEKKDEEEEEDSEEEDEDEEDGMFISNRSEIRSLRQQQDERIGNEKANRERKMQEKRMQDIRDRLASKFPEIRASIGTSSTSTVLAPARQPRPPSAPPTSTSSTAPKRAPSAPQVSARPERNGKITSHSNHSSIPPWHAHFKDKITAPPLPLPQLRPDRPRALICTHSNAACDDIYLKLLSSVDAADEYFLRQEQDSSSASESNNDITVNMSVLDQRARPVRLRLLRTGSGAAFTESLESKSALRVSPLCWLEPAESVEAVLRRLGGGELERAIPLPFDPASLVQQVDEALAFLLLDHVFSSPPVNKIKVPSALSLNGKDPVSTRSGSSTVFGEENERLCRLVEEDLGHAIQACSRAILNLKNCVKAELGKQRKGALAEAAQQQFKHLRARVSFYERMRETVKHVRRNRVPPIDAAILRQKAVVFCLEAADVICSTLSSANTLKFTHTKGHKGWLRVLCEVPASPPSTTGPPQLLDQRSPSIAGGQDPICGLIKPHHFLNGPISAALRFSAVIVDEAGQATEPDALMPLRLCLVGHRGAAQASQLGANSLSTTHHSGYSDFSIDGGSAPSGINGKQSKQTGVPLSWLQPLASFCNRLILIGDPLQLPATVLSPFAAQAGLGVSLFERLAGAGVKPLLLREQYRMHSAISSFSSKAFYSGFVRDAVQRQPQPLLTAASEEGSRELGFSTIISSSPLVASVMDAIRLHLHTPSERQSGAGGSLHDALIHSKIDPSKPLCRCDKPIVLMNVPHGMEAKGGHPLAIAGGRGGQMRKTQTNEGSSKSDFSVYNVQEAIVAVSTALHVLFSLDKVDRKVASLALRLAAAPASASASASDQGAQFNEEPTHSSEPSSHSALDDGVEMELSNVSRYSRHKPLVGILAPYREQVSLIRALLDHLFALSSQASIDGVEENGKPTTSSNLSEEETQFFLRLERLRPWKRHISVTTVDSTQGQERPVIVMSCVRSSNLGHPDRREPGNNSSLNRSIGFLADSRRLNVAITRAQRALFIVCNADYLKKSNKHWKALVEHVYSHPDGAVFDTSLSRHGGRPESDSGEKCCKKLQDTLDTVNSKVN